VSFTKDGLRVWNLLGFPETIKMFLLGKLLNLSMPNLADTVDPENIGITSANILGKEKGRPELISSPYPIRKWRL
jgi:hypothetical protein